MHTGREHNLCHIDAETLLVATYVWVDGTLKALQTQAPQTSAPLGQPLGYLVSHPLWALDHRLPPGTHGPGP